MNGALGREATAFSLFKPCLIMLPLAMSLQTPLLPLQIRRGKGAWEPHPAGNFVKCAMIHLSEVIDQDPSSLSTPSKNKATRAAKGSSNPLSTAAYRLPYLVTLVLRCCGVLFFFLFTFVSLSLPYSIFITFFYRYQGCSELFFLEGKLIFPSPANTTTSFLQSSLCKSTIKQRSF